MEQAATYFGLNGWFKALAPGQRRVQFGTQLVQSTTGQNNGLEKLGPQLGLIIGVSRLRPSMSLLRPCVLYSAEARSEFGFGRVSILPFDRRSSVIVKCSSALKDHR